VNKKQDLINIRHNAGRFFYRRKKVTKISDIIAKLRKLKVIYIYSRHDKKHCIKLNNTIILTADSKLELLELIKKNLK